LYDNWGSNCTYTWDIEGDTMKVWFGDKGSDMFLQTRFSEDGNSGTGRWQWPEGDGKVGGYELTMTRVK